MSTALITHYQYGVEIFEAVYFIQLEGIFSSILINTAPPAKKVKLDRPWRMHFRHCYKNRELSTATVVNSMFSCHVICILVVPFDSLAS